MYKKILTSSVLFGSFFLAFSLNSCSAPIELLPPTAEDFDISAPEWIDTNPEHKNGFDKLRRETYIKKAPTKEQMIPTSDVTYTAVFTYVDFLKDSLIPQDIENDIFYIYNGDGKATGTYGNWDEPGTFSHWLWHGSEEAGDFNRNGLLTYAIYDILSYGTKNVKFSDTLWEQRGKDGFDGNGKQISIWVSIYKITGEREIEDEGAPERPNPQATVEHLDEDKKLIWNVVCGNENISNAASHDKE